MPRKKTRNQADTRKVTATRKSSRKPALRQVASNNVSSTLTLERELLQGPAKIVALLTKESSSLKKLEKQLNTDLAQARKTVSQHSNTVKQARKNATTQTAKKQLTKARKLLAEASKFESTLANQYETVKKSLAKVATDIAKATELGKHLSQFEKVWSVKLKERAKAAAVTVAKAKARAKAKLQEAAARKKALAAAKATSTHDSKYDFIDKATPADFETRTYETEDKQPVDETVESAS